MDAARPHIGRMHARARSALVEHHQLLAFLEAPERRRQGADVHGLRRHVEEVRQDAADLGIEHADELPPHRNIDARKPLDGQREGMFLVHRRDIVEAVEIGNRLRICLLLDQLLGAAMQEPDMRVDTLDDLAVEFQHQTQNTVRRRVLRTEVDVEVADVVFGHCCALRMSE
jgi:hypothetical protein